MASDDADSDQENSIVYFLPHIDKLSRLMSTLNRVVGKGLFSAALAVKHFPVRQLEEAV